MKFTRCLICLFGFLFLVFPALAGETETIITYYDMAQTDSHVYYLGADALGQTWLEQTDAQGGSRRLGVLPYDGVEPSRDPHAVSCLVGDGETLYGFQLETGCLFPIRTEGEALAYGEPLRMDVSLLALGEEEILTPQSACIHEGVFYFSFVRSGALTLGGEVAAWDLHTGRGELLPVGSVLNAIPYKPGQVLLHTAPLYREADASVYVPETPELTVYDTAARTFARLSELPGWYAGGLAYDPQTNLIYYLESGALFCQGPGGEVQQVAFAPFGGINWNVQGFLMDGRYYNFDLSGAYSRSLSGSELPRRTLTICGPWDDEQQAGEIAFVRENSGVHLVFAEESPALSDLIITLETGEPAVDVLHGDSLRLAPLMEAGLLAPLEETEWIAQWVALLPEELQQAVTREGHIYALPLDFSVRCLAYDAQVLEAMDLTEADLPRTYPELFLFLTRWNREWADLPYRPLFPWGLRSDLFYDLMQAWTDRCERSGELLTFDTPLFRDLIEDLTAMDLSRLEVTDITQMEEALALPCLFTACTPQEALEDPRLVLWPLSLVSSEAPTLGGTLYAAAIPASGASRADALQLLRAYLDALSPARRAVLAPHAAQPADNPLYEGRIAQWQETWEQLSARQAEGALDVSAALAQHRWLLDHADAYRQLPSGEMLEAFRKLTPCLFLRRDQTLTLSPEDAMGFAAIEERFVTGSLSPGQFVREMERKVRMVRMMQQ